MIHPPKPNQTHTENQTHTKVSRSFGDAQFKGSGATAAPDVQVFTLTRRDRFMLLACDGFWGVRVMRRGRC